MAADDKDYQDDGGGKKKSKLLLIIVILVVLALLGGGGFFAFKMFMGGQDEQVQQSGLPNLVPQQRSAKAQIGALYPFETFVVNLADPGGTRYLKVTMSVELNSGSEKLMQELEMRKPQIRDIILTVLSSKSFEEVSTPQGKLSLKQEVIQKLNGVIASGGVNNLYITEFVVQ